MVKQKTPAEKGDQWKVGLGRMKRWYACQEIAKHLFDSTTSDLEVNLLLQQSATGMWNNQPKKVPFYADPNK